MSQLLSLYRLQTIDCQIDKSVTRLELIEKSLQNDDELQKAIDVAESISNEKKISENKQKKLEQEIHSLQIKISQTDSSLYGGGVRNPKELQDLQNELGALKRYMETLEERILETMLEVESLQNDFNTAQITLKATQLEHDKTNQNLTEEKSELLKTKKTLNTERLAITETLSEEALDQYENLRLARKGVAVTAIQENTCSSCGTTLTPAQVQNARSQEALTLCPSCGRILYGN